MNIDKFKREVPKAYSDSKVVDKKGKKDKKVKDKSVFKFMKSKKLQKPDMVAIIYLRNSGIAEPMEVQSKRGFFSIANKIYHEERDCIYTVVNKEIKQRVPLAIIPEWSLIPIGTKKWEDKEMIQKFSELEDHVIRGIRHAELVKMGDKSDKQLNMKQVIIWGLVALVAVAVLMSYF